MPKHSYKTIFKKSARAFFDFSTREKRRILLLLPLLVLITILFAWQDKPRFEQGFTMYADTKIDEKQNREKEYPKDSHHYASPDKGNGEKNSKNTYKAESKSKAPHKDSLFRFDPNTIDPEGLTALGFSVKQAQVIINYRNAGAVFRTPEDFAKCYTVSEEKFRQLLPYIDITTKPAAAKRPARQTAIPEATGENTATTQTTYKTNNSNNTSRPYTEEAKTHPTLLEINDADSAALVSVRGIGPLTAGRIIRYRNRLGGFSSVRQLAEIKGMYEQNYELISQQICVDSSKIKKIDINFAHPESMAGHPYIPRETLNKILKYRQLKGGWSNIRELIEQHILSEEEAKILSPYLYFRTK